MDIIIKKAKVVAGQTVSINVAISEGGIATPASNNNRVAKANKPVSTERKFNCHAANPVGGCMKTWRGPKTESAAYEARKLMCVPCSTAGADTKSIQFGATPAGSDTTTDELMPIDSMVETTETTDNGVEEFTLGTVDGTESISFN